MLGVREQVAELSTVAQYGGCRTSEGNGLGKLAWIQRRPAQLSILTAGPIITIAGFAGFVFLDDIQSVGYAGLFVISLISSATIFLPAPGGAAIIVAGAVLNPMLVGLVAGTGSAFGELTGYALGFAGQSKLQKGRWYQRVKRYMCGRTGLIIFVVAATPNPFMDLSGIAAGAICYPVRRFLLFTWMGKVIKMTALAFAISFGWQIVVG